MADFDQRQLLTNALPLLAVILMASGILVKTLPLESKRPVDPERAKVSHAGRQDVEARLWQDPFVAMRDVQGATPAARCEQAIGDAAHHPSTLTSSIRYVQGREGRRDKVTVLPVFVPGGPYFEDGESRRRARYATVMALFKAGWVSLEEDKLGFVWTFESCIEAPWARNIPELLPYEWFRKEENGDSLLILWVDEDAVTRNPLRGVTALTELIKYGGVECRLAVERDELASIPRSQRELARRLASAGVCVVDMTDFKASRDTKPTDRAKRRATRGAVAEAATSAMSASLLKAGACKKSTTPGGSRCEMIAVEMLCKAGCTTREDARAALPWERTAVIGPWTSATMFGLIGELARERVRAGSQEEAPAVAGVDLTLAGPHNDPHWLRFYSSGATAALDKDALCAPIAKELERAGKSPSGRPCPTDLREAFDARLVRLTTTDDQHTKALVHELQLRLVDATPLRGAVSLIRGREALCDDRIVIVAEGDTNYARAFSEEFRTQFKDQCKGRTPAVEQVSYLRGLDGVLPTGTGAPERAAAAPRNGKVPAQDVLLEEAALERADGPSQYDYLRRLAARLDDLDRSERKAGRHGVTAIGVLGNDAYDKILVLDALRDRFPKAVFFAADLDARLLGGGSIRSTRNLVVASGFGLSLQPDLQGRTPPFRDTYETGTYLSTLVALDSKASALKTPDFADWFSTPRMFEIGRTRPANLIPAPADRPKAGSCESPVPGVCKFVHADADWRSFDPLPGGLVAIAFLAMTLASAGLAFVLSRQARRVMLAAWFNATPAGVGALVSGTVLFIAGLYAIAWNVRSIDGEPFAWLEGVSIWPTQILRMVILVVTIALLLYGRWRLRRNIDEVAESFNLVTLSDREATPGPESRRGLWRRAKWLWRLGRDDHLAGAETTADPWREYVDRMRFRPSAERIAFTTLLFFALGVALISLDWPNSPHRGVVSAWFNHVLQLVLLGAVMALLFAALDASAMTTRFLGSLYPAAPYPRLAEPFIRGLAMDYPVSEEAIRLWTRFRLAVQLASAVNQLVYLPFFALLLLLPTRSRVFDSWDFPLPYAALLMISILLAVRSAMSLRQEAAKLQAHVLAELDREANKREIEAKLGATAPAGPPAREDSAATMAAAAPGADGLAAIEHADGRDRMIEPQLAPPSLQAELLRRIAGEIRAVRDGPFRPISQEPVVQGILLVLGGTGGITTAEFLFLSRG